MLSISESPFQGTQMYCFSTYIPIDEDNMLAGY
jgi:hypothetical protein